MWIEIATRNGIVLSGTRYNSIGRDTKTGSRSRLPALNQSSSVDDEPSQRLANSQPFPIRVRGGLATVVSVTDTPRPNRSARKSRRIRRAVAIMAVAFVVGGVTVSRGSTGGDDLARALAEGRTLDGSENNPNSTGLGQAGTAYTRLAAANYADGLGEPVEGPSERYVSNRIFNDSNQNIFSENGVSHWGFVWGQFLDHTIGLRESSEDEMQIAFDDADPLEEFTNDLGPITSTRSAAADGTGARSAREQVNTVSSFIDAWAVYGGSDERLDWLRAGPVDGDPTNNDAELLEVDGYLPTAAARPDDDAPAMELMGRLFADPSAAVIAGDVRANENLGLTAVHTLFLREHNRIVESLPDDMDEQTKFELARRVVSALQQYITYNEFLPSMGVELPAYGGYDETVDPSITNEFATVGYRAHSQIHGEFEAEIALSELSDDVREALEAQGVEVSVVGDVAEVAVPLNVAFGNPALLEQIGLGNLLAGLGSEAAYANDETDRQSAPERVVPGSRARRGGPVELSRRHLPSRGASPASTTWERST